MVMEKELRVQDLSWLVLTPCNQLHLLHAPKQLKSYPAVPWCACIA